MEKRPITVRIRIPFSKYVENQSVVEGLENAMKYVKPYFVKNKGERYWTVDKKGEEKGIIGVENNEDNHIFTWPNEFSLKLLDVGDDTTLIQEGSILNWDTFYNRYYVIKGGKLVDEEKEIKQILKNKLDIDAASMKTKYRNPYNASLNIATLLTKLEEKIDKR